MNMIAPYWLALTVALFACRWIGIALARKAYGPELGGEFGLNPLAFLLDWKLPGYPNTAVMLTAPAMLIEAYALVLVIVVVDGSQRMQ